MPAKGSNDKVRVKFIADEDVLFCGNLVAKSPPIKKRKSLSKTKVGNSSGKISTSSDCIDNKSVSNSHHERFSLQPGSESKTYLKLQRNSSLKTSTRESFLSDESIKSSCVSRSSSRFAESSFSISSRKSRAVAEFTECDESKTEIITPKKRSRRLPLDDDVGKQNGPTIPQSQKFNAETPRRSSKKIESYNENKKKIIRNSPLFVESPSSKRYKLRSISKHTVLKSHEISSDEFSCDTDDSSSSRPEEISSKLPINTNNTKRKSIKTNSSFSSMPSRKSPMPSTPKSNKLIEPKHLKTPAAIRKKLTKKFAAIHRKIEYDEELSSPSNFESSSDEYVPTSSDVESTEDENDEDNSAAVKNTQLLPIQERVSKLNHEIDGGKKTFDIDFSCRVDADNYFLSKCSKDPTSNNQLSSLEISHLGEDEIKNLLKNEYTKHETNKNLLICKHKSEFSKWLFYLNQNFNLLMYGLGSKIELIEYFQSEMLSMHDVLTIHGYFPRLLVKDILNSLITDVLKINAPKNVSEALPVIKSALNSRKSPVFVIIHNIDRLLSRQRKHQSVLNKLASFNKLHMIVSIDHINAPLLWGNSMLTELSFVWLNVTTYQPYLNETSFENLIYLTETGTNFVSLQSLRNIFKPLASRVKKIFQIIAKERLDNASNKQYKGMSYEDWYRHAKEKILVNSIMVFHVQLTELIDHGIIKMNDRQCIPILVKLDVLEKFYQEMYDNDEE